MFFNDSIEKSFTPSFDSWTTDEKTRTSEYRLDIRSAVKINSPKVLIAAHQTAARSGVANKAIDVTVSDHNDVGECHAGNDGISYPNGSVNLNYATNDCFDQHRDLKFFKKKMPMKH